jgi:GMP synthase (glutamine-hydrolysing)
MYSHDNIIVALIMFGTTSTKRISKVLVRLGVEYRILLPNETPSWKPTHVILSGSHKHVYESDGYQMPQWVLDTNCSVLGICYGMQLIVSTFGGTVVRMQQKEKGSVDVTEIIHNDLYSERNNKTVLKSIYQITSKRWMNRYDQVVSVPEIFDITGVTTNNHIASLTDHKKWWGIQYHPEAVDHVDFDVFKRFFRMSQSSST